MIRNSFPVRHLVAAIVEFYYLYAHVNATTVALTLLLAILGISAYWGLLEATVASVLATLGFNFFFLDPVYQRFDA